MLPPPRKLVPSQPPKRHDYERKEPRQNGLRFQPNQLFESVKELDNWISITYGANAHKVRVIKTWAVTRLACIIEKQ
jgi:hypothetical protein